MKRILSFLTVLCMLIGLLGLLSVSAAAADARYLAGASNPLTGDDFPFVAVIAIMVLSVGGFSVALIGKKRSKSTGKKETEEE